MQETFSLTDIARHLDRPESTVRHWRRTFEDFLPVQGSGRARRYTREALAVFEEIAAAYAEGMSTEAVESQLTATHEKTVTIDVSGPNRNDRNATAMSPATIEQGQEALVVFAYLERQREALENARQEIEELQQALEEMAAARDEAERKAEAALANAVTAKEMAYQAREEMRAVQLESAQREEQLKAWVEDRVRRPSLADRVRRMLRGDRR